MSQLRNDPSGESLSSAARYLFDAHERRLRFAPLPPELAPRNIAEAHEIQDAFGALRARRSSARLPVTSSR